MKIVRHTAPDMRQALRSIREQLGEEAVILSSRRIPQGVEITAAVDFDAASLEKAAPLAAPEERPPAPAASERAFAAQPPTLERAAPAPAAAAPLFEPQPEAPTEAMGKELQSLRRMLETQLAQLAWSDRTRRAPVHTELLRELTEIGIAQDLADHIVGQLDERVDLTQGRRFAIAGLSQYLLVTGDRWLETGGRVAFVGATGVGKTTMLAKLAVRWILRHGPGDLALVASDTVRIGAQDQMQALGQLLGVPVHVPERFEALPELLTRLQRHRLVLIDTPGSSLRDAQLGVRLSVLANCASKLETALVLAASTQAGALEEAVQRFRPANPASCLLTKIDEAASLGGALSVLIRARVPLSYTSDGQRVPEDLRPARSLELVSQAVRLAKATGAAADEDLLRRRFGRLSHATT
ncbi:MAG: flagellar biosynthesis protein FlhF [Gammaproteobacteria bacterium]|nr:flagellar biosynthesis protein FlhF [Gammaproteobacteria bacterium]MDE2262682.1 flagellar biosynthesis protein FlhF [Gammaproteobacteria bacterium]